MDPGAEAGDERCTVELMLLEESVVGALLQELNKVLLGHRSEIRLRPLALDRHE